MEKTKHEFDEYWWSGWEECEQYLYQKFHNEDKDFLDEME